MRVAALRILQIGAIIIVLAATTQTTFELDRFLVPKELVLHLVAFLAALFAFGAIRQNGFTRADKLLVIYLLLSAVSAALATNRWLGFRAFAVSASGVLIFWIARALRDSGLDRPLISALAVAVVLACMTALIQAYGVRLPIFSLRGVPGGTLANRNFVAHVAAIGLPLLFYVAIRYRFLIASIGVAIVSASLVLTRSRGAWLAAAVMLVVFIVTSRAWGRLFGVLAFAAAGVLAALIIPNALRWRSDNPYLESVRGVVSYDEGSGRGRLVQYRQSLWMAAAHPLLGVGTGNWSVVYPAYAARDDPSLNGSEPGMTFNAWPSSDWIAFISERGLIAAAILFLALLSIAFGSPGAEVLAIVAATVVAGLFDAVLLLPVPAFIFWASLGALSGGGQPPSAVRSPVIVILILISAIGAARSGAQLVAMGMIDRPRSAVVIDPGNYRIQMRLASRCEHARAAHALFPNAEAARAASRRCGGPP